MATEEAKAAASKLVEKLRIDVFEECKLPTGDLWYWAPVFERLIDAEFAPVVKKAAQYDEFTSGPETMSALSVMSKARKDDKSKLELERDDLKEALGELRITVRQRDDAEIGLLMGNISADEFKTIRSRFENAFAAAEKLLDPTAKEPVISWAQQMSYDQCEKAVTARLQSGEYDYEELQRIRQEEAEADEHDEREDR